MGGLTKDAAKGRGLLEKAAAGGVAAALEALGVDQVKEVGKQIEPIILNCQWRFKAFIHLIMLELC